jgi:hypothetical protein
MVRGNKRGEEKRREEKRKEEKREKNVIRGIEEKLFKREEG